jgi:hypothetical protein
MIMRTALRILLLSLLASQLMTTAASGETMIKMSLEEKVRAADLVVQGSIIDATARWGDESHSVIYTDYIVEVEEVLKGEVTGRTIVVTQQGGTLDGVSLQVGSNPELITGDRVVLFLAAADFLKGMARGDNRPKYSIVGVAQGTYYIVPGDQGAVAFQDFARLAIVPRPDLEVTERSRAEALRVELTLLRQAAERHPEDRSLARRVAQAEALLGPALQPPKRKQASDAQRSAVAEAQVDLGAKSPPPAAAPVEPDEEVSDTPPDEAQRERALSAAVEEHADRFMEVVEPIPLQELKERIKEASREAQ